MLNIFYLGFRGSFEQRISSVFLGMFEKLKAKWQVNGVQLFLILCTFAVTGTLTAYISRSITGWIGFNEHTFWLWKLLVRLLVLVFGYQAIILIVSFFFGQFPFFWNYEKKLLRWMMGKGRGRSLVETRNIIILASGTGSNARKIIDHFRSDPSVRVCLIASNKATAGVLGIARSENIPSLVIDKEKFFRGNGYVDEFKAMNPDLIVLAGFLWKLPLALVNAFPHRIINIHPALLPKYGGKGMYGHFVHEAVKAAGETETGITIHFVDELYDHGEYILQEKIAVDPDDSPADIALKVQKLEHHYFPLVIRELIEKSEK